MQTYSKQDNNKRKYEKSIENFNIEEELRLWLRVLDA